MADKKDTSLQSTKQMLDELDALMERMLSLPVSELDAPPAAPKETTKGPSLAASLTLLEPPVEAPAQAPPVKSSPTVATIAAPMAKKPLERRPRTKLPHPPIKPPHLSMPAVKIPVVPSATEPEPVPEPKPLTNEVVPTPSAADSPPPPASDPSASPHSGRRHGPLLWLNHRYDRSTMFLGGFGRLLRGPVGRTLLGLLGIASLAVAVGWVLKDWLGWNWQ